MIAARKLFREESAMSDNKCVQQIAMNFGIGSALGASIGERGLPERAALRERAAWRAAYAQRL